MPRVDWHSISVIINTPVTPYQSEMALHNIVSGHCFSSSVYQALNT